MKERKIDQHVDIGFLESGPAADEYDPESQRQSMFWKYPSSVIQISDINI